MSKLKPGFQTTKSPFLCITLVAGLEASSESKGITFRGMSSIPRAEHPIEEQAGKYKASDFPAFEASM
jgi:hypothetical protein